MGGTIRMSTAQIDTIRLEEILNTLNFYIHPTKLIKRKLKKWIIKAKIRN